MKKPSEDLKGLNITFKLTDRQRAVMAAAVQQEWFELLQQIMEEEIRKMNVVLMNTPVSKKEEVLANHVLAKAAAMFYAGIINRLEGECQAAAYAASDVGTIENPETLPLPEEFT